MSAEPVLSWDARVLLASEAAFGTVPDPAASQAFEFISVDTGVAELGEVRAKKDRNIGRGMTDGYVIGRVKPMPWSIESSIKTRSGLNTLPAEGALLRAAGLTEVVSSGVTYSLAGNPATNAADTGGGNSLQTMSMYRALGLGTGSTSDLYYAEQMRGMVAKELVFSFGDREAMIKASGEAIGKYHLGFSSSLTTADGSSTTLTFGSAEEAYRFGVGWYQWESEIIKISTAAAAAATTATMARAQLSSTGAAHSAKALVPYLPTVSFASGGAPMSEVNCVITIDSQTVRFQSGTVTLVTGIELGPGETGSAYVQTPIVKRYSVKVALKGLVRREDIALIGKASRHLTPISVTILCGTGTGGMVQFTLPYCEVDPAAIPDAANEAAYWTLNLRTRDSTTGNDLMTVTYT